MKKGLISIAVPTHTMGGENLKMLTQMLDSIKRQTYKKYEVIVSDQSEGNELKKLCKEYKADMKIKWLDNRQGMRASSANINNAIREAKGEYIKPLFLDDLLYSDYALEMMIDGVKKHKWLACGCLHYTESIDKVYRPHHPSIPQHKENEKENMKALAVGENLIGNPSVTLYRKCEIFFDDPLKFLTDTDFYYRMYLKYGLPKMINDQLVLIRIWQGSQQFSACDAELKTREVNYVKHKMIVLQ